jgi:hypothetical protein
VSATKSSCQGRAAIVDSITARLTARAWRLETWKRLTVDLLSEYREGFRTDSDNLAAAIRGEEVTGNPIEIELMLGSAKATVSGWDLPFAQALTNAIEDIMFAARDGKKSPPQSDAKRLTFSAALKKQIDAISEMEWRLVDSK